MNDPSHRQPVVAVFGSSTVRAGDPPYERARELGRALAEQGAAVMTGGYGGAMEACSRGAHEAGGHVVGVTVELFEPRGPANRWVVERVHTPDLFERLRRLVHDADGFVVATGSIGTLTELFLSWTLVSVEGRPFAPIVLMGAHWHRWLETHRGGEFVPEHLFRFVQVAESPDGAARAVVAGIAGARERRVQSAGAGGVA